MLYLALLSFKKMLYLALLSFKKMLYLALLSFLTLSLRFLRFKAHKVKSLFFTVMNHNLNMMQQRDIIRTKATTYSFL